MPRVNRLFGEQVTQRQIGVPRIGIQQSPDSFGAGVGKAVADIALNEQMKANKLATDQAVLDVERTQKQYLYGVGGKPGLLGLEGDAFIGLAGEAPARFELDAQKRLDQLSPVQREMAGPAVARLRAGFDETLAKHEAVQREAKYQAVYEGQIESRVEAVALEPTQANVAEQLGLANAAITGHLTAHPELTGPDPTEWSKSQRMQADHDIVTTAIDTAVKRGDHATAQAIMEKHGDSVMPEQREAVKQAVGDAGALGAVQAKGRELLPGLPDLSADAEPAKTFAESRKAFDEWAQANLSPEWQDKGMRWFDNRYAEQETVARAQQAEVASSLVDVLQEGAGGNVLDVENSSEFRSLDKTQQETLRQSAKAMRDGIDDLKASKIQNKFEDFLFSTDPAHRQTGREFDLRQIRALVGPERFEAMRDLQKAENSALGLKAEVKGVVMNYVDALYPKGDVDDVETAGLRAQAMDTAYRLLREAEVASDPVEAQKLIGLYFDPKILDGKTVGFFSDTTSPDEIARETGLDPVNVAAAMAAAETLYGAKATRDEVVGLARLMQSEATGIPLADLPTGSPLDRHRSERVVDPLKESEASAALQWVPRNPRDG